MVFFLAGCSVCNPPYLEFKKGECCLDSNSDKICDSDQKEAVAQADLKKQALEKLDEAKKTVEEGALPSLSNITSSLTGNRTCRLYTCQEVSPSCEQENTFIDCITPDDCYAWSLRTGASEADVSEMKKEGRFSCA